MMSDLISSQCAAGRQMGGTGGQTDSLRGTDKGMGRLVWRKTRRLRERERARARARARARERQTDRQGFNLVDVSS